MSAHQYRISSPTAAFQQESTDEEPHFQHGVEDSIPSALDNQYNVQADRRAKSAYFNQASEKSISHTEAKLFFQRHQLESSQQQQAPDDYSRLRRSRTYSPSIETHGDLSRKTSTASKTNRHAGQWGERSESPITPTCDTAPQSLFTNGFESHGAGLDDHPEVASLEGGMDNASKGLGADVHQATGHGSDISPELSEISKNIKRILDLRHKYIRLSLQGQKDNPKDREGWKIYPPPPRPIWDENKTRPPNAHTDSNARHGEEDAQLGRVSAVGDRTSFKSLADSSTKRQETPSSTKERKPGHDIGEDFDMDDLVPLPEDDPDVIVRLDESSVFQIYSQESQTLLVKVPNLREYYMDMDEIQNVSSDGPTKSFAYRQLDILEGNFHLYFLVNSYQETAECKRAPHRDFYNVRKVDTHVHHSACMNQKHLLRFIKSKMKKSPCEVVTFRDGIEMTLEQVFHSINLTAYDLSIDTLDMHAHTDSFHRFDKFNLKYNPIGESRLREIFLKTDNYIKGRYLAEITKEVISDLEASKYQFVEWRVSIYGRSLQEWDKLAAWVVDNRLISHNVRWLIQIPRLYSMYKATGQMESFEEIIINIFQPLYNVTKNPSSNPKLHVFLQRVVGFDSVDDESKIETRLYRKFPPPREWTTKQNPPYTYWIYHLFANMTALNVWRQRRGFNTFVLRPHCGEAGDVDHIAAAVLCCHSISHGLMLRKVPLLQYVFYLDQIGIAMSPLSNNALFLAYDRNPFSKYFKRGLNVSLSTDDPLQFAFTKEPLIEEYSVAAQIYKLSAVDMCELAQHSVLQSGFEHELKQRWLGDGYDIPGVQGNNVAKSNVPNIREKFRHDTLVQELQMLERYAAAAAEPATRTPTAIQTPSPIVKMTNSLSLSTGQVPGSPTNSEFRGSAMQDAGTGSDAGTSSLSPIKTSGSYRAHDDHATVQPKIFPGIVHERTRRQSVRQGWARDAAESAEIVCVPAVAEQLA